MKISAATIALLFLFSPAYSQSPGGVSANLQIWLRADANGSTTTDGTALTIWDNPAGGNFDIVHGDPTYEIDAGNLLNFNPVIKFDGNDYLSNNTTNFGLSNLELHTYAVIKEFTSENPIHAQHAFIGPNDFYTNGVDFVMNEADDAVRLETYSGTNILDAAIDRNRPAFYGVSRSDTGQGRFSNTGLHSNHGTETTLWNENARYFVGASHYVGVLHGTMPELILYNRQLNALEEQKLESYLAMKYGFTLDGTGGGTNGDYVFSNGTTVWDASDNPAFHNDIIAVAKDYDGGLLQNSPCSPTTAWPSTSAVWQPTTSAIPLLSATTSPPSSSATTVANWPQNPTNRVSQKNPLACFQGSTGSGK